MRILLAAVLGAGLAILVVVPAPASLLLATMILLVAFLLGAVKAAVDLVDLVRTDVIADAALLLTLGVAFALFTRGDRVFLGSLTALALATQVAPLVIARRARLRKPRF